jgi:hypothetical protein
MNRLNPFLLAPPTKNKKKKKKKKLKKERKEVNEEQGIICIIKPRYVEF